MPSTRATASKRSGSRNPRRGARPDGGAVRHRRQAGAFAIMTVPLIILMIGFCGLALDLGQLYNRKVDLNGLSKAVALAAAAQLNGTASGIAAARAAALTTAQALHYHYFNDGIAFTWSDAALAFSTSASRAGSWTDGSAPTGLYYVKVDTSALAPSIGQVNTFLLRILSSSLSTMALSDSVIAGRKQIYVSAIAVCAMDASPATARTDSGASATELVEYGFRRGVSYDLMQLNPNGTSPVSYLINPVIAPGVYSAAFDTSVLGPFMCTGTMWIPRVSGGALRVSPLPSAAPLTGLYSQLNTRFDDFSSGQCGPYGAPPDYNVKSYAYDTAGGVAWMTPATGSAAAASTTSRGRLETIADLPVPPSGTAAGAYGPLWANAKAVKYSSYVSLGTPEPGTGYTAFSTSEWKYLYPSGPTVSTYPSSTPYGATSGANYKAPGSANSPISTSSRRVLNVPLLSCPVATGSNVPATVLGIGKFFMTVPATQSRLIAEFAGTLADQSVSSQVELYP